MDVRRDTGFGDEGTGDPLPVDGPATLAERETLRRIGRRARRTNLARAERLDTLLQRAAGVALSEVERGEARTLAHQIVGSAGTFGYDRASRLALQVERYLGRREGADTTETASVRRVVADLLEQLRG